MSYDPAYSDQGPADDRHPAAQHAPFQPYYSPADPADAAHSERPAPAYAPDPSAYAPYSAAPGAHYEPYAPAAGAQAPYAPDPPPYAPSYASDPEPEAASPTAPDGHSSAGSAAADPHGGAAPYAPPSGAARGMAPAGAAAGYAPEETRSYAQPSEPSYGPPDDEARAGEGAGARSAGGATPYAPLSAGGPAQYAPEPAQYAAGRPGSPGRGAGAEDAGSAAMYAPEPAQYEAHGYAPDAGRGHGTPEHSAGAAAAAGAASYAPEAAQQRLALSYAPDSEREERPPEDAQMASCSTGAPDALGAAPFAPEPAAPYAAPSYAPDSQREERLPEYAHEEDTSAGPPADAGAAPYAPGPERYAVPSYAPDSERESGSPEHAQAASCSTGAPDAMSAAPYAPEPAAPYAAPSYASDPEHESRSPEQASMASASVGAPAALSAAPYAPERMRSDALQAQQRACVQDMDKESSSPDQTPGSSPCVASTRPQAERQEPRQEPAGSPMDAQPTIGSPMDVQPVHHEPLTSSPVGAQLHHEEVAAAEHAAHREPPPLAPPPSLPPLLDGQGAPVAAEYFEWASCNCDTSFVSSLLARPDCIQYGFKERHLENKGKWCDSPDAAECVFSLKTRLDSVDPSRFLPARGSANVHERLRRSVFQNRAAIKMADLDHLFALTAVDDLPSDPAPRAGPGGVLTYLDLCAGPGGFVEYIYWRRGRDRARGWGITLRGGSMDFRLDKFCAAARPADTFSPCYGEDGTGDVTNEANLRSLAQVVAEGTGGAGVSLATADGGVGVEGRENFQEICTKRLLLCEFVAALMCLRKGGNFVCKIFDCYSSFTVGLLFVMYMSFDRVSVVKPVTSRPANSERYLVCCGLRERSPRAAIDHLLRVNAELERLGDNPGDPSPPDLGSDDVITVVPDECIAQSEFAGYIRRTNERLARLQVEALQDLWRHIEDPSLGPQHEVDLHAYYSLWGLPENGPAPPPNPHAQRKDAAPSAAATAPAPAARAAPAAAAAAAAGAGESPAKPESAGAPEAVEPPAKRKRYIVPASETKQDEPHFVLDSKARDAIRKLLQKPAPRPVSQPAAGAHGAAKKAHRAPPRRKEDPDAASGGTRVRVVIPKRK
eukprot:m51a1_g1313 hypothetical protein (1115) ;mRNA; f:218276-221752